MRRLPVYLLIDTSGSMRGEPIESVKVGLEAMVSSYEKYAIIVENCDCGTDQFDFVVQEGKVLDEVENNISKED